MDLNRIYCSPEFIRPLIFPIKMLSCSNIEIFEDHLPKSTRYWLHTVTVPILVLFYASQIANLMEIMTKDHLIINLVNAIPIFMITTQVLLKTTIIFPNRGKIKQIIDDLSSIWRTAGLTDIQLKKKDEVLTKVYTCQRVLFYIAMLGCCIYSLTPLVQTLVRHFYLKQESDLLLPFPCKYPFDPTKTWLRYIAVYVIQCYSISQCVFVYIGGEFIVISLCSHLVSEFTILREDLLHLRPYNSKVDEDVENDERELKNVIKRHQKLIELTQTLDEISNKLNFIILLFATVTICFFAFAAKVSDDGIFIITNYIAIMGLLGPLSILCYFSELLAKESSGIAESAYENLWYEGDRNYQKTICFIILRSQRVCCLTSMKYSPINLAAFSKVLSTTWSYFSLINRVYEDIE